MRPDGSRITRLVRSADAAEPAIVSRDGSTVAYREDDDVYVSRANGTGFRRLVRDGMATALSRDGRLLAFQRHGIWIVGTRGHGLRRLTAGAEDAASAWSPDGKAVVFTAQGRKGSTTVVLQPLDGRRRVLARGGRSADWSPDGRWIAYRLDAGRRSGLYVVRPDGLRRHRVARGGTWPFAWSPDGSRLAFGVGSLHPDVAVVGADGRRLRRLRLRGLSFLVALTWSPDGRRLALQAGDVGQLWVVGGDGRGLRRVTNGGTNWLVGWTALAPVGPPEPPLLPSEWVLGPDTVATRTPITDLSADGPRVAFAVGRTAADCDHPVVWTPATQALDRFHSPVPCAYLTVGTVYDMALAGSRVAWATVTGCGNHCDAELDTATLEQRSPLPLASTLGGPGGDFPDFHVHGDGDLLVFDIHSRLVRVGGTERCQELDIETSICTTLRSDVHAVAADSVSGGLIAVREPDAVAVLDAQGNLVRYLPFGRDEVKAARLDGGRLIVARSGVLQVYDVATGGGELQRPLPSGYELEDVDGGIAVLRHAASVMLLRLDDGRSFTLSPGREPVSAELEPPGLYYSYATADGGGRVVFLPRSEVVRQLGGGER